MKQQAISALLQFQRIARFSLSVIMTVNSLGLSASGFYSISKNEKLPVYFPNEEENVTKTAVDLFFTDIQTVLGAQPFTGKSPEESKLIVITVGQNPGSAKWLEEQGVSVKEIENRWEAFKIQIIGNGKDKKLLILGSDKRGTAYGVLELSRLVGVSPWYWWTDVTPSKKEFFSLPTDYINIQQPSVQYRGLFINDEDWGLTPWSKNTFEPESTISLGVKTYEKVFELLLRLRANTLWPAMHGVSTPFYYIEGAKEMADKYGIVVGTSHCEPLMRNTNGEWKVSGVGEYNYLTNKVNVNTFWEERLREVNRHENIYTIGMRGIHDGRMLGAETTDEQTVATADVFVNQRELLSKHVNADLTKVPQAFMPYKEVLDVYNNGLSVPDDVTIVWCDDNYGYITKLSDEQEQQRTGGSGVYYHISYYGKPHDYLWLYTTQPGLIYSEMKRAWDHGAQKMWILNAGDIKPGEYGIEFFLDFAWDINSLTSNTIYEHLHAWLESNFDNASRELTAIMNEYFRLAAIRRPEFMAWSRVQEYRHSNRKDGATPVQETDFNPFIFGDELQKRVDAYTALSTKVRDISQGVRPERIDAFFQLIEYPVCAASLMNQKHLYAQKARLFSRHALPVADEYAALSKKAYNELIALTEKFNKSISGGKWNGIMDMQPRKLPVFDPPFLPQKSSPDKQKTAVLWLEGDSVPLNSKLSKTLPDFIAAVGNTRFISVFSSNEGNAVWEVTEKPDWLNIEEMHTGLAFERKIVLSLKEKKKFNLKKEPLTIRVDGHIYQLEVQAGNGEKGRKTETDRKIAWNASDYESTSGSEPIQGLGHSAKAISLSKDAEVFYEVQTKSQGDAVLYVALIPTHSPSGNKLRYSISIDGGEKQIIEFNAYEDRMEQWKVNVLRGQALTKTAHKIYGSGKHIIRIQALDEPVILDQLMLDFEANRRFYQIPAEDRTTKAFEIQHIESN